MSVKLLTEQCLEILSLKGGCTGSYEATLVKMPHCWKSRVTAQSVLLIKQYPYNKRAGIQYKVQVCMCIQQRFKSVWVPAVLFFCLKKCWKAWLPINRPLKTDQTARICRLI